MKTSVDRTFGRRSAAAWILLIALASCRQQMADQPKYRAMEASSFFPDGRTVRPLPAGTVARGHLNADERFYTGKSNGELVDTLPIKLTREVLERGRERFNIYCSPCHGETGDGQGMIVLRGLLHGPPSYHIDRLREAPIGYFFDVMTNGFGGMLDYSAQISPEDRWAIAAYVRALQLSQKAAINEVPEPERQKLESEK